MRTTSSKPVPRTTIRPGTVLLGCIALLAAPAQVPAQPFHATLWTPHFNDSAGWSSDPSNYETIQFADLNADGKADVCGRGSAGIYCALSNGSGFGSLSLWSGELDNYNYWNIHESYWKTIRLADVNADQRADVCGRGYAGIYCALSNGSSFGALQLWTNSFGDVNGWHTHPAYWQTIQFPDLNLDGKADVCGRGAAGLYCGLSTGTSFDSITLWFGELSDALGWASSPSRWSTIQFVKLHPAATVNPWVCARWADGVRCTPSLFHLTGERRFGGSSYEEVASEFSDSTGWSQEQYYSTIQFGDVNEDGSGDICGRGPQGVICGFGSSDGIFYWVRLFLPEFSDANGWNLERHYKSIRLVDVDGDGKADVCGRGWEGILCARGRFTGQWLELAFHPLQLWIDNFGDNWGWGGLPAYWRTVQPANVRPGVGAEWCGRGTAGIYCGGP